ncbi:MAG: hypothetical protein IJX72_04560, partial [Clostridia bacterium]|nr:hypothetical protein [Clostridia bacterium]
MNKSRFYRILAACAVAVVLAVLSLIAGVGICFLLPDFDALPLFFILTAAFILACTVNRIAAKAFARNHFGMPPEERRELFNQHMEQCQRDPETVLKGFSDMEIMPIFMLVLYFFLNLSMSMAAGMCLTMAMESTLHYWVGIIGLLICIFLLHMPMVRLFEQFPAKLNKAALVPTSYLPTLEAMAKRAADTVGIKGSIRLEIDRDCDCAINQFGQTYVVFLGTRLLSVLTEEEMYQTLLRTFDYFTHVKEHRTMLLRHRLGMLGAADIRRETFAFDLFFSYADVYLEWEYEPYRTALRRYMDHAAYERIRTDGDPLIAVKAKAKEAMWKYFIFESNDYITEPFYLEPTPHKHYERNVCNAFRKAVHKRHKAWLVLLDREIRRIGDGSTFFREERIHLDPDGASTLDEITVLDIDSTYGQEVNKAIREIGEPRLYHDIVRGYKEAREREYLEPLRTIEAYEASPEAYSTPELSPVINAYRDICRHKDAEALCDRIMETETNQFALAHAIYFKGMCMLHRYETEGIDLIYRAIDLNKNYMKDGFEMVEEYCTLCGLADEYEAFLRRAEIQVSAHAYNHED